MTTPAPQKTITVTISISTNPAATGRYFIDMRDTTGGADRQMTTRITDDPAAFLAELHPYADRAGVEVTTVDDTGENVLAAA